MNSASDKEVRSWLEKCFKEHLKSFEFEVIGLTENGSGFAGDVLFAHVTGIDNQGAKKEYDLVLKCDKTSSALREKYDTFNTTYKRETKVYETIFPYFQQFQHEKGVKNPFDSVVKCYGVCNGSRFVIVMDNLKKLGYDLYDCKQPLTRNHINLVVREYAKFHAISMALKEQKPEEFQRLTEDFQTDSLNDFFKESEFGSALQKIVIELHELLKNDQSEETLTKLLKFKDKLPLVIDEIAADKDALQALVHGDCWSNNFMYKYEDNEKSIVSKVAILDWQTTKVSSPIVDLSYFLFACISPHDVADLKTILKEYYKVLCSSLSEMGCTYLTKHSFEKLYQDWKKHSTFGLMMCLLPIKVSYAEKQDLPDLSLSAEKDEDITASFNFCIKNTDSFKGRLGPIIKYCVQTGII